MTTNTTASLFQIVEAGDAITVRFPRSCELNGTNSDDFARAISAHIEGRATPRLVIDLGNVGFLGSTALSKFIAINAQVRTANGRFSVVNASDVVREVFRVTKLDTLIDLSNEQATVSA